MSGQSGLKAEERKALLEIVKDGVDARGMLMMWLLSRPDSDDPAKTAQMLIEDIEDAQEEALLQSPLIELLREVALINADELARMPRQRKGGRRGRLEAKPQS